MRLTERQLVNRIVPLYFLPVRHHSLICKIYISCSTLWVGLSHFKSPIAVLGVEPREKSIEISGYYPVAVQTQFGCE